MKGGFVVQRHNELRDLEAELLNLVCKDVETEPVLQDIMGEVLSRGANTSQEARVDIYARGFGRGNDLPSLMLGHATQMQNRTPILAHNRFTASMKTKRTKIRRTDFTDRTRNFHTIDIYNYWRNGTRMSDVS